MERSVAEQSRLADSPSAYLRSAAHQPVEWYPWGPEAFERARELDRPVLLDIGAVWCHWCHVIDRESYENEETARIVNELYVAIKVDRDERPDVDARYQQGVGALSGQGGWPLTGFLTPDGDVFWGGTYFPPEDRYGRPGFPRVLREVAAFYAEHRDDALHQGEQVRQSIARSAALSEGGTPGPELLDAIVSGIRGEYDSRHGGFGNQPKFPHPAAIDLLMQQHLRADDAGLMDIAAHTLRAMGEGGVYDQLGGGFHRYSVDARWIVPHFEKMLYDNAGLLRNYAWATALTDEPLFRKIATGIVAHVDGLGSDRALGGFYASQDADIGLDDDGDYWTWTLDEVREVLDEDETRVALLYYGVEEVGDMQENPAKNVLHVARSVDAISAQLDMPGPDVERLLETAGSKLLSARSGRDAPYVDTAIYTNWNGMMVQAYLEASRLLDLSTCRDFALTTLDRILSEAFDESSGVRHVVGRATDAPETLDDQVQIGLACVAAYQATGDTSCLDAATCIADILINRFLDSKARGFLDTPPGGGDVELLNTPMKPVQDSPTASANGCAIQFMEMLHRATGGERYHRIALETAAAFAQHAADLGLFGGAYAIGLSALHDPAPVVVVIGAKTSDATRAMRDALLRVPKPGALVITHDPAEPTDSLPEAVRGMLDHGSTDGEPLAFICSGMTCYPPTSDLDAAVDLLRQA